MKNQLIIAAAIIAATASTVTAAENIAELAIVPVNYSEPGLSATPKMLRGTYEFKDNGILSYEFMLGVGIADGTTKYGSTNVNIGVGSFAGAYIKASNKLNEQMEVFARLGGASIKRDASANGRSLSNGDSGGGVSYGVGLKYNINDKNSLSFDYMSYYTKNSINFNGVGIGISTKF